MSSIQKVSVFGGGHQIQEDNWAYIQAREVGKLLGKHNIVVKTGAGSGVMEAAMLGAIKTGGQDMVECCCLWDKVPSVQQQPHSIHASSLLLEVIDNRPVMQWAARLGWLLESDAFIGIWCDETPGTLVETCAVANLAQKLWKTPKPFVIINSHDFTPGPSPENLFPDMLTPPFKICYDAEVAIQLIFAE